MIQFVLTKQHRSNSNVRLSDRPSQTRSSSASPNLAILYGSLYDMADSQPHGESHDLLYPLASRVGLRQARGIPSRRNPRFNRREQVNRTACLNQEPSRRLSCGFFLFKQWLLSATKPPWAARSAQAAKIVYMYH